MDRTFPLTHSVVDCPRSGPGQVRGFFSGPEPGPPGPVQLMAGPDLDLTGPGPLGSGQVRARSEPGPSILNCIYYMPVFI